MTYKWALPRPSAGADMPIQEQTVTRYRFDAAKEIFVKDEIKILLEREPMKVKGPCSFGEGCEGAARLPIFETGHINARQVAIPGAMREIFRCKIFSKFKGTTNYVAKKYRDHVEADDDMYFTDCKMQVILAPASRAF
jgi:hypothetical protein